MRITIDNIFIRKLIVIKTIHSNNKHNGVKWIIQVQHFTMLYVAINDRENVCFYSILLRHVCDNTFLRCH